MDLLRKDAGEVVSSKIRLHDFDLFAMLVLAHIALLIDIVGACLSPIPFVSRLC